MRNISDKYTKCVPITQILGTVAAWTLSYASNMVKLTADTTAETAQIIVPLAMPKLNDSGEMSTEAKVESVGVSYTVGTAALSAVVVAELQEVAKAVDGAAPVAATIAATVLGAVVADTKTVDDHMVSSTPDANAIVTGDKELLLEMSFPKAATSTVAITGVKVNYKKMNA